MRRAPHVVQETPAYLVQLRDRGHVQVSDARQHIKELLNQERPVPLIRYGRCVGLLLPITDGPWRYSDEMAPAIRKALLRAARALKADS